MLSKTRYDDDDDELIIMGLAYLHQAQQKKKRQHRWWVHDLLRKRSDFGAYNHLVRELELDEKKFCEYFRVSKAQFDEILGIISPALVKKNLTREAIPPQQMLAICLR